MSFFLLAHISSGGVLNHPAPSFGEPGGHHSTIPALVEPHEKAPGQEEVLAASPDARLQAGLVCRGPDAPQRGRVIDNSSSSRREELLADPEEATDVWAG